MARRKNTIGVTWGDNPTSRQVVREAALSCFRQYGVHRTSMADIAEAADISRKTLYRVFADRTALIEHLIAYRLAELGTSIREKVRGFKDFETALIDGPIATVALGQEDPLFVEIILAATNHRIEQFLLRGNPQIISHMNETWFPVLEEGRKQGIVRKELSNERIVEIIMHMQLLLWMGDDLGPAEQRSLMRDVLWPAVTYA
ncbi:MAG: TetR/AcrR family transcriptional regulator [Gammaproteobacteria bacterium]|nr:TetR/AcrR family transcriptional regulator [Gammaproteobacteria bacterium]MYH14733.1 TetR/AcrR family transcriptional regulator [Gammaproteobacteria bacterium]